MGSWLAPPEWGPRFSRPPGSPELTAPACLESLSPLAFWLLSPTPPCQADQASRVCCHLAEWDWVRDQDIH